MGLDLKGSEKTKTKKPADGRLLKGKQHSGTKKHGPDAGHLVEW